MQKTHKALFSIVALMTIGLATLLLAEGFLRLFPGFVPPERRQFMMVDVDNAGVKHSYIGHLHTPNANRHLSGPDFDVRQTTGAYGFRNSGAWPQCADIVVLGDSLAFGHGVADSFAWPAIVDHAFPGVKVVNLGLVGAGAEQYLRVYKTFGEPLRPKLVIVGMFPGNDFWDAGKFHDWLREGGQGNYMVWRNYGGYSGTVWKQPVRAAQSLFVRHSYLYNLIVAARSNREAKSAGEPKIVRLKSGEEIRLLPSEFEARTIGSQPGRTEFELTVRALGELRDEVRKGGGQILVVLQPSKEEVYAPMLGEKVRDASAGLRPALERLRIEYLDLAPSFKREASTGKALFFEADGHPNHVGYRLIADEVIEYLTGRISTVGSRSALRRISPPPLCSAATTTTSGEAGHRSPVAQTRRGGDQ